jgi:hypothetical protein
MSGNQSKSKNQMILIISGIVAVMGIASLYHTMTSENGSNTKISDIPLTPSVGSSQEKKSKSDQEVDEISSKMILLMHWKFITDTSNDLSDISDALRTKKFDVVQEKLNYFSGEYDRHKSNLQTLDIVEKYEPVRNKMIQYVEITQGALEQMSAGIQNDDSEAMTEATNSLIKAKNIENEISTIIKVW